MSIPTPVSTAGRGPGQKEFIALMALLMACMSISIDAMLPALGVIGQDLRVSHPNQPQYIISAIFAGIALGELFGGPLADAYGRKTLLFTGLLVYLAGSILCIAAMTIETMLLGRFIQGLGIAGPFVSVMSIIRDRHSGRAMARILSLVMMIFIMVPVVAPAIGQGILLVAPWRYIFGFYILYALVMGLWAFLRLPETLPPAGRIPFRPSTIFRSAKTVLSHPTTLAYTLATGCIFGGLVGNLNSIQQVFRDIYGIQEMFAVYFGLAALAFGVSSFLNARLVERLGMRTLCLWAVLLTVTASAVMLAVTAAAAPPFWLYFLYSMLFLFCMGILFGNMNALAMEPMGAQAGMAAAIIGSFSSAIGILAGTFIGQMYDGTLVPVVMGFLLLNIAAFLVMLYERRRTACS